MVVWAFSWVSPQEPDLEQQKLNRHPSPEQSLVEKALVTVVWTFPWNYPKGIVLKNDQ